MQIIPLENLGIILIPAAAVVAILWCWTGNAKVSIYAISRMIGQLCLIGFLLTYIFETKHAVLVFLVLMVMLLTSSWIALRSVIEQRVNLYIKALIATFTVNVTLLFLITQLVLESEPWFNPRIAIPIAGMTFAVGMNAISLFIERYHSELTQNPTQQTQARNTAYNATLIPTINSLLAVGLVSLPGMMTGQILSGISPLIAVRYQIMIMLMLFASSGLTSALFYQLINKQYKPH